MKKLVVYLSLIFTLSAYGQGPLTPPGAPAQTMKTLDQIEARTLIASLPFTISQSGSYYLVTNLAGTAGITVSIGNVTIDLNGFSLTQPPGAAPGVFAIDGASANNVTVRNGRLLDWTGGGIRLGPVAHIEDVNAENCGTGIRVGEQSHVLRCRAGGCSAGDGFTLGNICLIEDCRAIANGTNGIAAGTSCQVRRCIATHNKGDGIRIADQCIVADNLVDHNGNGVGVGGGGAGIHATGDDNRIENNQALDADCGLDTDGTGNYVAGNTVKGNRDNYEIAASNQLNLLICQIPETLDWPCSVKLAGTLTCSTEGVNGITVNANDVTIDMAGHTLVGPGVNSGHGICQDASYRNLTVLNGKTVNWQAFNKGGVRAGTFAILSGLQAVTNYFGILAEQGSTLSHCAASYNRGDGIYVYSGCTLSHCAASYNRGTGIEASVGCTLSDCAAYHNGGTGIFPGSWSTLSDCAASGNGSYGIYADYGCTLSDCATSDNSSDGIYADYGSTLSHCAASYNGGYGIYAGYGCALSDCAAHANSSDGISVFSYNRVVNCVCYHNGNNDDGAGIHATSDGNRIEGNNVTGNDRGIDVDVAGNFIVRNTASGNTLNWDIAAGNVCLVVKATPTTIPISGDSGGTAPGSTDPNGKDPNANFTY